MTELFKKIYNELSKTTMLMWKRRFVIGVLMLSLSIFIGWFYLNPDSFSYINKNDDSDERIINGIYYWCTMTSTIGFGDITPNTKNAKIMTMCYQFFLILLSLGVIKHITDDDSY